MSLQTPVYFSFPQVPDHPSVSRFPSFRTDVSFSSFLCQSTCREKIHRLHSLKHFHHFLLSESIRAVKPNRKLFADIPESSRSDHNHRYQTPIKQLLYKSTAICLHPPGTTGWSKQTLTTLHRQSGDQVMFDPGLNEAAVDSPFCLGSFLTEWTSWRFFDYSTAQRLNVYRAELWQEVAPVSLTDRSHISQNQPDAKLTFNLLLANKQEMKIIQVEASCPSEQPIRRSLPPDQPIEVVSVLRRVRLHPVNWSPNSKPPDTFQSALKEHFYPGRVERLLNVITLIVSI